MISVLWPFALKKDLALATASPLVLVEDFAGVAPGLAGGELAESAGSDVGSDNSSTGARTASSLISLSRISSLE